MLNCLQLLFSLYNAQLLKFVEEGRRGLANIRQLFAFLLTAQVRQLGLTWTHILHKVVATAADCFAASM